MPEEPRPNRKHVNQIKVRLDDEAPANARPQRLDVILPTHHNPVTGFDVKDCQPSTKRELINIFRTKLRRGRLFEFELQAV